jgi:anti-sigma B factor antagonist
MIDEACVGSGYSGRAGPHDVVLRLRGELDLASAPEFESALSEAMNAEPCRIIVDLHSLDFMDCTGISLLIRAQQSAHALGHKLVLRRGPAQVQRLFQLTGLREHFTFAG